MHYHQKIRPLIVLLSFIMLACAVKSQQSGYAPQAKPEAGAHATAPVGHAAHAPAAPAADGPWSYLSRDNPKPYTDKRWEMIPVPAYGHMYVSTGGLDSELVCEALRDNPGIMIDREMRRACGMPETLLSSAPARVVVTEKAAAQEAVPREHHPGTAPHHDGHDGMQEHWMAPEEAAKRLNPVQPTLASIERGRKLYQTHCAVCHGPRGRGDGPAGIALKPRPTDLVEMAGQHPDGDFAWKIENGRGPMPAWKGILTETQIWDLVNFIRDLAKPEPKAKPKPQRHDEPGQAH